MLTALEEASLVDHVSLSKMDLAEHHKISMSQPYISQYRFLSQYRENFNLKEKKWKNEIVGLYT